ncbi:LPS-assembly protein LptD [Pseudobythopirellula maris]|uniref:LPS-assembly protein LptD n=2 Tax=Pseudobythopirellula maris TaxID=2527991 RepID=A0A5C5ZV22_9BACT|nr:LPS-assembly protein LptD [Pseudobythopirellula maris]
MLIAWGSLTPRALAEVRFPPPDLAEPVAIEAARAERWTEGGRTAWRLTGGVRLEQGNTVWAAPSAVVWVDAPDSFDTPTRLTLYLEGTDDKPVRRELRTRYPSEGFAGVDAPPIASEESPDWFGSLESIGGVDWRTPPPADTPTDPGGVVARGRVRLLAEAGAMPPRVDTAVERAGATGESEAAMQRVTPVQFGQVAPPPAPAAALTSGFRRIHLHSRDGAGLNAEGLQTPGGESAAVFMGGINIVVEGIESPELSQTLGGADSVDLEADRLVMWTAGADQLRGGQFQQRSDTPLEFYMEGNIVFRQGERTIYADRMYYDARRQTGVVLNAEILTPLPEIDDYQYRGLVRLKAAALRQLDASRFVADDAVFTTSRLENPSYSLRSDQIMFEDSQRPLIDPVTGQQRVDPYTGAPQFAHRQVATSEGNRVLIGNTPILYWPTIRTDLEEPSFYVKDFRVRSDSVFGVQVLTEFDVHQLLGAEKPPGADWGLNLDYMNERGLGYGTNYEYRVDEFSGFTGPAKGLLDAWAINDDGTDNLGLGRRNIVPERGFRGRGFWNHKQHVTDGLLQGWDAQAEVGYQSDRTFLEQYYEREWDTLKDQTTGARFKRRLDNQSLSIEANVRVNEFYTETQWLPRLDHYLIGQDLGMATWFAHSQVGYAKYDVASQPSNATLASTYNVFPWEGKFEGERAVTRQEIDLPLNFDPVKVVPFFLGEAAHWGSDLTRNDEQRLYLHTGVRASVPFWAVNPDIRDPLFNLNGLAHKVVLEGEISYADATRNVTGLPLYDQLEDNPYEEIRRRLFGLPLAATDDPRFYLVRSGEQGWVTSPVTEIADDLQVARLGMRHRLQTKRGPAGAEHIVDWFTFDSNASFYPEADRDNFGESFGLIDYDMKWHIGDRFTVLSDGFTDLFGDGLRTIAGGVSFNRPSRGNVYVGYRSIRGPFDSDLLIARVNYRTGPKWIASASAVVDFGDAGNIGQNFALSRIGESLIVTTGISVDESKGNVGLNFMVEPRFMPRLNLTRRTGIDVPPSGAYGLE